MVLLTFGLVMPFAQMGLPRSDSDSPLPDWLSQHASPPKPLELLSDSDEDDDHVVKHDAHPQSSDKGPDDEKEQNGGGQHGRANRTKWKAHASVLLSSDDEERPQNGVQESAKRQKVPQAAGPVGPGAGKGKKLQQADLKGWMQSQAASNDGTVPQSQVKYPAVHASAPLSYDTTEAWMLKSGAVHAQQAAGEAEDATQGAAGPSSQPAKEKKAAAKAAMVASLKGEIPVMLPEKLPANKVHSCCTQGHFLPSARQQSLFRAPTCTRWHSSAAHKSSCRMLLCSHAWLWASRLLRVNAWRLRAANCGVDSYQQDPPPRSSLWSWRRATTAAQTWQGMRVWWAAGWCSRGPKLGRSRSCSWTSRAFCTRPAWCGAPSHSPASARTIKRSTCTGIWGFALM